MTGPTCPRCGACDLDFTDHDGACFPACARDLDALDLDLDLCADPTPFCACGRRVGECDGSRRGCVLADPDVERWEVEERRADARRARWGHE